MGKLYGFFFVGNAISLISDDAMIDVKTGKIGNSVVSSLSEFIEKKGEFTILENVPIMLEN